MREERGKRNLNGTKSRCSHIVAYQMPRVGQELEDDKVSTGSLRFGLFWLSGGKYRLTALEAFQSIVFAYMLFNIRDCSSMSLMPVAWA